MYVQYVRLANPGAQTPLLMWRGGGMTGVNWETTPDGRPGWQMFYLRADPAKRGPYEGPRFPADHFDAFLAQCVPRWDCNDERTQDAYSALLGRFDKGAIILTHSRGGSVGLMSAVLHADRVRAVISLEPSGAPDPAVHDARLLQEVPHLSPGPILWTDTPSGSIPCAPRAATSPGSICRPLEYMAAATRS